MKAWWITASVNLIIGVGLAMLVCSTSSYGKEPSGSNEHPALPRIPGSIIVAYERNDQGKITIPLERIVFDLQTQKFNNFKTTSASGRLTRILYALPTKSTTQEAAQYYTDALHQANGEILFSGAQDGLDNGNDRFANQVYYGHVPDGIYNLLLLNRKNGYVAGRFNWNGSDVYVQVYTFANREGHRTSLVRKDRVGALVETIEVGPAHAPTALVTSQQMASEINRTGRIALYGLYFRYKSDRNQTGIQAHIGTDCGSAET